MFAVDAEVAVDCGPQVVGGERAVLGAFAFGIGGANDLPGPHAAAADQHRHRAGPVIAAGLHRLGLGADLGIDAGRAAELAGDDDQRPLEQSPASSAHLSLLPSTRPP